VRTLTQHAQRNQTRVCVCLTPVTTACRAFTTACLPACSQCVHSRLAAVARHKQAKQKVGGRARRQLNLQAVLRQPTRIAVLGARRNSPCSRRQHSAHMCCCCCWLLLPVQAAAAGGPLGLASAQSGLSSTLLRREGMSEPEAASWLLDLAGSGPLAQLAARGIPASIDRCVWPAAGAGGAAAGAHQATACLSV
jgi:hypothetical protein